MTKCAKCGAEDRVVETRPVTFRVGAEGELQAHGRATVLRCRKCDDVFLPLRWEYGDVVEPRRSRRRLFGG